MTVPRSKAVDHRAFRKLFPEFSAPSWQPWNSIEDAMHGVLPSDPELVRRVTRRQSLPAEPVSEVWIGKGRGSGGSRTVGRWGTYFATARTYKLAPGEKMYVGIFGPTQKQAAITHAYVRGLLRSVPALARLIVRETADVIELSNGVVIEVISANLAAPRGRAYALVIIEEAAFLPTDASANPDTELLRSVRPALARVPGSLLVVISSPYAARGELYRTWREKFGKDDPHVLVVMADTRTLNPSFSQREIDRAFAEDPASARAEYGRDGVIEFRSDVATLLGDAALTAVVPVGLRELPPDPTRQKRAHFDAATGSGEDAAGLGIAFDGEPAQLAVARRWTPPFDPTVVVREAAELCRRYGVEEITIDRFAPGLVAALFSRHGIQCRPADRDTSATFVELMGLINCGGVALLDDPTLLHELRRLERRPGSGGRETVSHPPHGHDDLAAACAGALVPAAVIARRELPELQIFCPGDGPSVDRSSADFREALARYRRLYGLPEETDVQ